MTTGGLTTLHPRTDPQRSPAPANHCAWSIPARFFATAGYRFPYGSDRIEPYRRAAGYVDRILKGEKPADLPVQAPTKFELVINLQDRKGVGLKVPTTLLARADEVIE